MTLPTEKQSPSITPDNAKILLYGPEGIGKTSLAAALDPDHTLILATEPGTGGIEAYVQPIRSWPEFLAVAAELQKGEHNFKVVVVDTSDELQRMCQEYVIATYNEGKPPSKQITHPSDLEYGKGWDALSREWRRLAKFCSLGFGVVFTSHSKEEEIELPVGKMSKQIPTLTGSAAKWLRGFVEFIFFATFEKVDGEEVRVLRTQTVASWTAKQRVPEGHPPLPDPLPLGKSPTESAALLYAALLRSSKPIKSEAKAVGRASPRQSVREPAGTAA